MNSKKLITMNDVANEAMGVALDLPHKARIWGIPRGGVPAALAVFAASLQRAAQHHAPCQIVDHPEQATVLIDDIWDTGDTAKRFQKRYAKPVRALFDKRDSRWKGKWLVMPWETADNEVDGAADIVTRLLQYIGEDPKREGLLDTPARVLQAWKEWATGYSLNPADILKTFSDGAQNVDEMVIVHNIPFVSKCVIAGTMIETPRGPMPIEFLKHGDWVYTVDPKTLQITVAKCRNPRITQKKAELVRVYCDHDTLVCTPDHKILTYNRSWVQAKDLQAGDRIVSMYRSVQDGYINLSVGKRRGGGLAKFNSRGSRHEHDVVATQIFGKGGKRYSRVVHHEDERTWNNSPENLEPMSIKEHNKKHRRFSEANTPGTATNKKRLEAVIRSTKDPKVRAKRAASVRAHWVGLSEKQRSERKQAMSDGLIANRNHRVITVERLTQKADVWCMDVPGTRTFFANRMAVHNCEHHLADVIGVAHVGYIPNGKIVGLSKLARLVDCFARRLQVQERATVQIADALVEHLAPIGVGVLVRASHACMSTRGVKVHGSVTTTSAMRGALMEKGEARKEFLDLCAMAEKQTCQW